MTTLTTHPVPSTSTRRQPGKLRRTALVVTGVLACVIPTVFTVNLSRMLITGVDSDHQFHQATGQGLILFALWLVPILGLLRAGWRGERPSTALGLQHLAFALTGVACAAAAPGGGAPILTGVIVVTGALLWLALPQRPRLRAGVQIHPVLAPVALLTTAFFMPYAIDQIQLQNAATTGYHSENPHFFDMAWMVSTLMVLALAAAVLPAARHLMGWVGRASIVIGAAGLAFGEGTTWSLAVLGLGLVAAVAHAGAGRR